MEKIKSVNGALVFLFAVLANLVIQFIASIVIVFADVGSSPTFNFVMMALIQASFFFVFYRCTVKRKLELSLSVKNKINYATLAFAPVIAALCICAFYLLTFWFMFGLSKAGFTPAADVVMNTPFEFVLGSFVLCVAAPICEELIFRGALLSGLRSKYGVVPSVLLSATAFMLMHMNPAQTVYQFLLGIVCALTALAAGSVLPAMVIHAFSNMFAILIDYTALGTGIERFMTFLTARPGIAVVVTLACFAVFGFLILLCVYFVRKFNGKNADAGTLELENRPLASKPVVDEDGKRTIEKHEKIMKALDNKDKLVYVVACGVCTMMWVIALVSGFIS